MKKITIMLATLILSGLLLSSCGFKLRGTGIQLSAKFQKTYIDDDNINDTNFYDRIKKLIVLNGARLVDQKQAIIGVHFSPIKVSSRQIALSDNGSLKEYEKTYSTTITVIDESNDIHLGSRVITTVRNVQLDDEHVLANEEQMNTTSEDAYHTLAQSVLLYLQSY